MGTIKSRWREGEAKGERGREGRVKQKAKVTQVALKDDPLTDLIGNLCLQIFNLCLQ